MSPDDPVADPSVAETTPLVTPPRRSPASFATRAAGARDDVLSQGTRFAAVGVVNTAFGFGVFAALELSLGDRVPYIYLVLVAHVIGVLEAYVMQRRLVFRVAGNWLRDLGRFWLVYLVALAVNLALLPLLVEVVRIPVLPAQALVLLLTALGSFLAHRNFTFRRRPGQQGDGRT